LYSEISDEEAIHAIQATVDNAFKAAGDEDIVVVGSIGPMPFAPMAEYHPNQYLSKFSVAELEKWHEPRFKVFYESKCHVIGLETIPGTKEIEALLNLLHKYPKDAYLCLACSFHQEDCLNSGEPIVDALEMVKRIAPPSLKGIGTNCTKPQFISSFGRLAQKILPDLTLVTYPNSGEEWHAGSSTEWEVKEGSWVGERKNIVDFIPEWQEIGFKWIGGCCRVTPEEIQQISEVMK